MTKNLISVVDDDESTRRTTTLLLESLGFQASAFESAETFLESGQVHQTSCLIVDVRMPEMDGLQLQSHLAAAGYSIPIIFITAYDSDDSRQRAMQAGAVAFLGKPFGDELLLQTIRAALRRKFGVTKALISVVDDDESVRRTTTLLIESFGYRAAAFESAESFLRAAKLDDTACLIVDIQMPGMNGLQLQSHLAAAGSSIPIIFITAYDDKESRQQALQAGAVAFLGKPFSDKLLHQTIGAALRQQEGDTTT
jgi:FixJ family two-component response regulator